MEVGQTHEFELLGVSKLMSLSSTHEFSGSRIAFLMRRREHVMQFGTHALNDLIFERRRAKAT